jgi:pseudouridine kinase
MTAPLRPSVACIGGAHIDRRGITLGPARPGTSNIGTMRQDFGGVARNVAATLARLGADVRLASRVGRDAEGDAVLDHARTLGIDTGWVTRSEATRTASYTAILDSAGELAIGFADMAIYDEITPMGLLPALDALADARLWFLDTNLPAMVLVLAAGRGTGRLVCANAISVDRAPRLRPVLSDLGVLFANRREAATILDVETLNPRLLAGGLMAMGARAGVITAGADEGVVWSDGEVRPLCPMAAHPRDVTGAGDALVAGTLHGLLQDQSLFDAVRLGLAAAALTVESDHSVAPDLSADALQARLKA